MMRTGLFYWWAVVLVAAADQLTKQLIMSYIPYQEMVDLLPCLALVHVYNTGAAFSFLSQSGGWQAYLFIAIALVALIIIGVSLARIPRRQWVYCLSLALIAGGAVGNVIDRICYGHVVDFILFYIRGVFTYPAFNVADSAICVGVALLIIRSLFFDRKPAVDAGAGQVAVAGEGAVVRQGDGTPQGRGAGEETS